MCSFVFNKITQKVGKFSGLIDYVSFKNKRRWKQDLLGGGKNDM